MMPLIILSRKQTEKALIRLHMLADMCLCYLLMTNMFSYYVAYLCCEILYVANMKVQCITCLIGRTKIEELTKLKLSPVMR